MKKIIIAGASAVLAAMPVVGAFAATSNSFTDTLNVTVNGGCTLEETGGTTGDYSHTDRTFSGSFDAGTINYLNAADGSTAPSTANTTVTCNTSDSSRTWTVSVAVTGLTYTPQSGDPVTIAGGTDTTGAASKWAIKSNATGTTESNPFQSYAAAANGTFLSATADNAVSFNPSYRVYVAAGQTPGLYTGTAVYSIQLGQ